MDESVSFLESDTRKFLIQMALTAAAIVYCIDQHKSYLNTNYAYEQSYFIIQVKEGRIFVTLTNSLALILGVFVCPSPSWNMIKMTCLLWYLHMTGVCVGYHRMFSHRAFEGRWIVRVALAIFGSMSGQGGPI